MSNKNKFEKFMEIVGNGAKAVFGNSDVKENFKSSNLKGTDTEVQYSEKVGGVATVAGGNGSEALTDGKYELTNGDVITVKEGKVEEIELAVPAEELAKEDEPKEDEKVDEPVGDVEISIEEIVEEIEKTEPKEEEKKMENEDVDALKAEIESLKEQIKALKGDFSKAPNAEEIEKKIFANVMAKIQKTTVKTEEFAEEVASKVWTGFRK